MDKSTKHSKSFFEKASPVRFFIIAATLFGLTFLLITPPFQSPDEPSHFYRAYQISQGKLRVEKVGDKAGGILPASLEKTVDIVGTGSLIFQPNAKYDIHKTKHALSIKEKPSDKKFYDFRGTAYYSAVSYLPQSLGILLARLAQLPPILMMYSAKFMVLCVWIILLAFSIRFMPRKKWALVAVGLLPMALFQATSLSADVMAYGLLALAFSLILKFTNEKKYVNPKKITGLLLLLTALTLGKQIMFIFPFLVLLLPSNAFKNKKDQYLKKSILIILPLVFFFAWMISVHSVSITATAALHPVPNEQLRFIFYHPLGYLHAVLGTYFFASSDLIARSFIGDFGWLDTPLSEFFAALGYISLAFLFLVNYESQKVWLKVKDKYILGGLWILYFFAVNTALYVYYDPIKDRVVEGVQGRYFIPLALISIPLLFGNWIKTSESTYRKGAVILPIILLIASTITIFYRYYVHAIV